ncbi:uncharacterized protein V6R79_023292 [Siganus canaliculatus]
MKSEPLQFCVKQSRRLCTCGFTLSSVPDRKHASSVSLKSQLSIFISERPHRRPPLLSAVTGVWSCFVFLSWSHFDPRFKSASHEKQCEAKKQRHNVYNSFLHCSLFQRCIEVTIDHMGSDNVLTVITSSHFSRFKIWLCLQEGRRQLVPGCRRGEIKKEEAYSCCVASQSVMFEWVCPPAPLLSYFQLLCGDKCFLFSADKQKYVESNM